MTISWSGLAVSLVLVAVAAGVSLLWRLGLERSVVWAATRALVQLLLVGGVLVLLLAPGVSVWWSWLWIAAMIAYAAWTAQRRAPSIPGLVPVAAAAFLAAGTSLLLLATRRVGMRSYIPFGPFLVAGAVIAIVIDQRLLEVVR